MVERGLGLAFLPHLAVSREIRRGSLVAIEIADGEPLSRSLDVIHSRRRALSSEALAFLRTLRATVTAVEAPRKPAGRRRARPARRHAAS